MPRLLHSLPRYRKHKASGQAIVTLGGQDHYLGPHGTRVSKREYDRLIAEWLATDRQPGPSKCATEDGLSLVEAIARYWLYVKTYYVKHGRPTGEQACIRAALRPVKSLYGDTLATNFSPTSLKAIRIQMVEAGLARSTVNKNVSRVRRFFRWLASEKLIPFATYQALTVVDGLKKGRTTAREPKPISPIDDTTVEQTLPFLTTVVRDMVQVQRLTGMRPGEICLLRPCDIDRTGEVWMFTPQSHKSEHRGSRRIVCIGPRAECLLLKYLARASEAFCFAPSDSEAKRLAARHAVRRVPITCGNRPGSNRRRKPRRAAGDCYSVGAYRRAIHRACDKTFPAPDGLARCDGETDRQRLLRLTDTQRVELAKWQTDHRWSPNQLRHAAATGIRQRFGLEAAQTVLGHSRADVTQIYAERDYTLAARVAREVG